MNETPASAHLPHDAIHTREIAQGEGSEASGSGGGRGLA